MSMCSIPTCLCATLKSLFNSVDDPPCRPLLPPLWRQEVRAPLFTPLLIISSNLRRQAWAAMSIPLLKAATGRHTPFCLLLLSLWGGVEGDGSAVQKRGSEREMWEKTKGRRKWALTPGKRSRQWQMRWHIHLTSDKQHERVGIMLMTIPANYQNMIASC